MAGEGRLPISARLSPSADAASPFLPDTTLPSRHILLVDDSEEYRYATCRSLEQAGYKVTIASDYRQALPILEGTAPLDLMITDIVMPGQIHGFSLANMARMRRKNLRLIFVTAFDVNLDLAEGPVVLKSEGVEKLLQKVGELFLV